MRKPVAKPDAIGCRPCNDSRSLDKKQSNAKDPDTRIQSTSAFSGNTYDPNIRAGRYKYLPLNKINSVFGLY